MYNERCIFQTQIIDTMQEKETTLPRNA